MRLFLLLALVVLLLGGCKKEKYGTLRQEIKVTSQSQQGVMRYLKASNGLYHTHLGDHIVSLTPQSFKGLLLVVRFHAENDDFSPKMTLVMRQPYIGEEPLVADFSNGATLAVIPELNGDMMQNPDGIGGYYRNDVTFKMLWLCMGILQQVELPEEYANVSLAQFSHYTSEHAVKSGRMLTTSLMPLNQVVPELSVFIGGNSMHFAFGISDSTYITHGPFLAVPPTYHVRSSNYVPWTMTPPLVDEVRTNVSTIGFVTDNIIQVYAGSDNVPYTSDDIVVFEPRYWERMYIQVDQR